MNVDPRRRVRGGGQMEFQKLEWATRTYKKAVERHKGPESTSLRFLSQIDFTKAAVCCIVAG